MEDEGKEMQFNWHYDRMNFGACMNDAYFMHGEMCEHPKKKGFLYNDINKDIVTLEMDDDDIAVHTGMTMHILTGGVIKA